MIDLHCHYLPGVDDGPRDMANALALASAAVENGIVHAVLTPHVFFGRYSNYLKQLRTQFDMFAARLRAENIALEVSLGAEVRLMPESIALYENGQMPFVGRLGGRPVVLLEFHDGHIPVGAEKGCEYFLARGVLPMIAHPERNRGVMANPDRLRPFIDMGCLLQITAASVCGDFGPQLQRVSMELLGRQWTYAVASDAHNLAHRPPRMAQARDVIYQEFGMQACVDLTERNPGRMVERQRADAAGAAAQAGNPAAPAGGRSKPDAKVA